MKNNILGGLSAEQFLAEYWQKKPLVIKQAYPDFECPISAEELAGLALEEEVESRLLLEKGGEKPWQVLHGPLTEEHFTSLGESHWTLLVQEANRHIPDVSRILDDFSFIPSWRIDDIMISFAPPGGSVGPHTDQYDVFLLQAYGNRRWSLSYKEVCCDDYQPGLDHQVLKEFHGEEEHLLEPGDMLYLPPGVIHHGVAETDCMTFSIGLRAHTNKELLAGVIPHLLEAVSERRYTDPELSLNPHPGTLRKQELAKLRQLIRSSLEDDVLLNKSLALFYSESPNAILSEQPEYEESWRPELAAGALLVRSDDFRFVMIETQGQQPVLFVNGHQYQLTEEQIPLATLISDQRLLDYSQLEVHLTAANTSLVDEFLHQGYLYLE